MPSRTETGVRAPGPSTRRILRFEAGARRRLGARAARLGRVRAPLPWARSRRASVRPAAAAPATLVTDAKGAVATALCSLGDPHGPVAAKSDGLAAGRRGSSLTTPGRAARRRQPSLDLASSSQPDEFASRPSRVAPSRRCSGARVRPEGRQAVAVSVLASGGRGCVDPVPQRPHPSDALAARTELDSRKQLRHGRRRGKRRIARPHFSGRFSSALRPVGQRVLDGPSLSARTALRRAAFGRARGRLFSRSIDRCAVCGVYVFVGMCALPRAICARDSRRIASWTFDTILEPLKRLQRSRSVQTFGIPAVQPESTAGDLITFRTTR